MRDKRYCASFRFALRAFLSETPKSKLFWSAVGALIGTGINSVIGVFTSTFNYQSSSVWISKGLGSAFVDVVRSCSITKQETNSEA